MATALEREPKLIRKRLDSIEEALSEEMSEDDKRAYAEAIHEHMEGKTVPFVRSRKR
jgi:RNA binding exosome subunit